MNTKKTGYILKIIFFVYTVYCLISKNRLSYNEIIILLAVAAVHIYREKYNKAFYVTGLGLVIACAGAWLDPCFAILLCISAFDFSSSDAPYAFAAPILCQIILLHASANLPFLLLVTCICCLFGYTLKKAQKKRSGIHIGFRPRKTSAL